MPKLISSDDLPKDLKKIISQYNRLGEEDHIQKLFCLQKITHMIFGSSNPKVIFWQNIIGDMGLNSHLQHYGIHQNASILVQSIEFANAIRQVSPYKSPPAQEEYYSALRARDKLLKSEITPEGVADYMDHNLAIMAAYDKDPHLQERVNRHQHFLSLSYAKVQAIQGYIKENQSFDEYQTDVLGNLKGNNKNFILRVAGVEERLVIRVQDREKLGSEQELQSYPVSEYFSEDYMTIRVPVVNPSRTFYQDVAVSQFANEGDLLHYAERLVGKKPKSITKEAQEIFSQIADFNIKLNTSGHYHPDIKLSNFLYDGGRLIISDRKAIMKGATDQPGWLKTTAAYAPPEFKDEQMRKKPASMASYMSYQTGMALKEFMFKSLALPDDYLAERAPLSQYVSKPSNEIRNISVLIQELTRTDPRNRLSMEHFHILMQEVDLPHKEFMERLEALFPQHDLKLIKLHEVVGLELVEAFLEAEEIDSDLRGSLDSLLTSDTFSELWKNEAMWEVRDKETMLFREKLRQYQSGITQYDVDEISELDLADIDDEEIELDAVDVNNEEVAELGLIKPGSPEEHFEVAVLNDLLGSMLGRKYQNPHQNVPVFFSREPAQIIKKYLKGIDDALHKADKQKASGLELFLDWIGYERVPRVTSIPELGDKMPTMDAFTKHCVEVGYKLGFKQFPGLNKVEQALLNERAKVFLGNPNSEEESLLKAIRNALPKDSTEMMASMLGAKSPSDSSKAEQDVAKDETDSLVASPSAVVRAIEKGNQKGFSGNAKEKLRELRQQAGSTPSAEDPGAADRQGHGL